MAGEYRLDRYCPYGTGKRMKLKYTRAMIAAALNNELARGAPYQEHPVFNLQIPCELPQCAG